MTSVVREHYNVKLEAPSNSIAVINTGILESPQLSSSALLSWTCVGFTEHCLSIAATERRGCRASAGFTGQLYGREREAERVMNED
ncbi:hypothetical protein MHYP_G00110720 [Metynnis hypsauchen]